MRILGIVLIILGVVGFFIGSVSFTQEETVADLGPVEIEREETRSFPITPVAAGFAVAAWVVLVVADVRRTRTWMYLRTSENREDDGRLAPLPSSSTPTSAP